VGQPELKKIEENWILVTYDIPASEGALRKKILRRMRGLGAFQYTESVYYLPFTPEGMQTSRKICSGKGYAFTWYSRLPMDEAEKLTARYINDLAQAIDDLEAKVLDLENLLRKTGPRSEKVVWRIKELKAMYRGLVKAVEIAGVTDLSDRLAHVGQLLDALKRFTP